MIKFRQKVFSGALVGEEYKSRKEKSIDSKISSAKNELDKFKEKMKEYKSSPEILKTSQGGMKTYRTKIDRARYRSLQDISRLEQKGAKSEEINKALLNHTINYGKKKKNR